MTLELHFQVLGIKQRTVVGSLDFHIELIAPVESRPSLSVWMEGSLDSSLLLGALRDLGWLNIAGFMQE